MSKKCQKEMDFIANPAVRPEHRESPTRHGLVSPQGASLVATLYNYAGGYNAMNLSLETGCFQQQATNFFAVEPLLLGRPNLQFWRSLGFSD